VEVAAPPAGLVLHRVDPPVRVELHHVSDAHQPQALAPDRQPPLHPDALFRPRLRLVCSLVRLSPPQGEDVLVVHLLQVDQPALPGAVRVVLDGRDHD
jgi:hypothetical protein